MSIDMPNGSKGKLSRLIAVLALAYPHLPALAQVSYFSVDTSNATTGTMGLAPTNLSSVQLSNPSSLTAGVNNFNYAAVFFQPTNSGSYTFGQTAAPVDTVMIVYSGVFNPATPGAGALVGNDDTDQASHRNTVGDATLTTSCGGSSGWCPQVRANVTAGRPYTILISSYNANASVGLPLTFYSDGAGSFFANSVTLTTPGVFNSATVLGNAPALGAARVIDANSNLANMFNGLSGDRAVSDAASQTLPLLNGGTIVATQAVVSRINRIVQARLDANRGMSSGDEFSRDRNFWMKPFGTRADQDNHDGVAGYQADTVGLAAGFDGSPSKEWRLGGAFAYAHTNIDSNSVGAGSQSAKVDMYQLIAYGNHSLDDRTEINFQADVGKNTNQGRRVIAFSSALAASDYTSHSAHLGIGIARSYPLSSTTTLTPSLRADYTTIKEDAYSESGAGLLNLNVNSRSAEAFVVGLDGRLTHRLSGRTTLHANLGVGYDTINKGVSVTSSFAGAPASTFLTEGITPAPWIATAGLGAVYKTTNGLEIIGRYDAEHRTDFLNQTVSARLRWAF